ncbi:hypothetical protein GKR56_17285 [Providencia alcalifaciens]|uniref:Uncharacterized protein n=1 Tax=Providencia hangzhouensis TaxID=3031799 RepID=A0ABY9ZF92_9GAMM|nr:MULTISPECIES: hypothetical protein [Providencia]ELR5029749.1 hypothetical protein [Providencia rettgeri]ELR5127970.1 hypothetical protein [Providencia rettgeri]MTC54977.1 hypothetical protein [Providencia alcalifaciens]WNK26104.1 hypothetical protein PZ638_09650 [Providencia hangzhouensis]
MNKELLEYAKELKKRSESLIKAELENEEFTFRLNDWDKLIHPKMLIQLCNEIERINNLQPVVYASEKDISDLKIFTYLFAERQSSESVNIPLYRLDK